MNSQDFEFVAQLLRKRAGIVLTGDKMYLLESRLAPLARKEGLPSIDDLIHVVRSRREERLIGQVVDVMTTNETFFFRDKTPFDHLREAIFPLLGAARRGSAHPGVVRGSLDGAGALLDRHAARPASGTDWRRTCRDRRAPTSRTAASSVRGRACSRSLKCSGACRSRC